MFYGEAFNVQTIKPRIFRQIFVKLSNKFIEMEEVVREDEDFMEFFRVFARDLMEKCSGMFSKQRIIETMKNGEDYKETGVSYDFNTL